jgi:hypothetical protein
LCKSLHYCNNFGVIQKKCMRSDFKIIFFSRLLFPQAHHLNLHYSFNFDWLLLKIFAKICNNQSFSKYHTRNNKQRRSTRAPAAERVQSSIEREKYCLLSSFLCFLQTKNEIWTVTKGKVCLLQNKKQKSILWWFGLVLFCHLQPASWKKSLITINYFSIFSF